MSSSRLSPFSVLKLLREFRDGAGSPRPIALAGAAELVPLLAKELRDGGDAGSVVERGSPERCSALVWIGPADDEALRAASRAKVPVVGVTEGESLPYVLDTQLVTLQPGRGLPVEAIARALARVLGGAGPGLAARLPALREPVVDELIRTCARQNGLIGAAVFVPGVDFPILTLNELRLVLRIAVAYGHDVGPARWPELLGVVGGGMGLRTLAGELLDLVPVAGWAVKGGIAYGGTMAIGEAARLRFRDSSPDADRSVRPGS